MLVQNYDFGWPDGRWSGLGPAGSTTPGQSSSYLLTTLSSSSPTGSVGHEWVKTTRTLVCAPFSLPLYCIVF